MTTPPQNRRPVFDDTEAVELLARQWRDNRRERLAAVPQTGTALRNFYDDSYRWARDALMQLKVAGITMHVTDKGRDSLAEGEGKE